MIDDDVSKIIDNHTLPESNGEENFVEKSTEERINAIINELNALISNISSSKQISQAVAQSQALVQSQAVDPRQNPLPQAIVHGETATQIQKIIGGQLQTLQSTTQGQAQGQVPKATDINVNVNSAINQTALTLVAINSVKTELCRLPLDFCEREYIANCVTPLVTAMEFLSRTGFDLATSVNILTTSPIVPRKKGKLKDTIHTIYSINEEVEDVYKVLKKRFKKITRDGGSCGC